jgi:hypothetical protein
VYVAERLGETVNEEVVVAFRVLLVCSGVFLIVWPAGVVLAGLKSAFWVCLRVYSSYQVQVAVFPYFGHDGEEFVGEDSEVC